MSVFDGEIEFQSVYMVDYKKKDKPKSPRRKGRADDCLIVGVSRDALRALHAPRAQYDVLCPWEQEYYKTAVDRIAEDHPKIANKYLSEDIDPTPIENEIQDLKRTEYLTKYCSRDLPFMSVNLTRRARALQTVTLPDDVYIPDTTSRGSYRAPPPDKYKERPSAASLKPKHDDTLQRELRRILRVHTGDTAYGACHSLLGQVIQERQPYGKSRKEPHYGRWRNPYLYTYPIRN